MRFQSFFVLMTVQPSFLASSFANARALLMRQKLRWIGVGSY